MKIKRLYRLLRFKIYRYFIRILSDRKRYLFKAIVYNDNAYLTIDRITILEYTQKDAEIIALKHFRKKHSNVADQIKLEFVR